jgi:hypothetical protein
MKVSIFHLRLRDPVMGMGNTLTTLVLFQVARRSDSVYIYLNSDPRVRHSGGGKGKPGTEEDKSRQEGEHGTERGAGGDDVTGGQYPVRDPPCSLGH